MQKPSVTHTLWYIEPEYKFSGHERWFGRLWIREPHRHWFEVLGLLRLQLNPLLNWQACCARAGFGWSFAGAAFAFAFFLVGTSRQQSP